MVIKIILMRKITS